MKKISAVLVATLMAMVWNGCATQSQEAIEPMSSLSELLAELDQDLKAAKAGDVNVLAPEQYRKAQDLYAKARASMDKGAKFSTIQGQVAQSRQNLMQAQDIARVARMILADTNEAREKAIAAGGRDLGSPFQQVEDRYLKLTAAIGSNDIRYAQDNAAMIQQAFHDVEIMAIKHQALDQTRRLIAQADQERIERIVPQARAQAGEALAAADFFIGQSPYESEAIAEKSAHALFMAQRMLALAKSGPRFQDAAPESTALFMEEQIAILSKALNVGDLRNLDLPDQVNILSEAARNMVSANRSLTDLNQSYQAQIAAMEQRISGLQGFSRQQEVVRERLTAEREFNERFDQVQNYFTPKDAEVYKQGNQLVIRMRGIKFPVGQATLTAENYSLLSKVQRAIRTSNAASILIEGHTDSTGSIGLNQRLSQERAEAVQAYLSANDPGLTGRIKSLGYGSDRPLASNDTSEGRAVNRRIDVRITPAPAQ